ncbi:MAG: hypothetical protein MJ016_07410 [Victivallaceae bacterium]|nr:hypothetical protein [Victivallaceae bacterium]
MAGILRKFSSISLPFPEKAILFRLGGRAGKTAMTGDFAATYDKYARAAFGACRIEGRFRTLDITGFTPDGVALENGGFLPGKKFAASIAGSRKLWCAAATVGAGFIGERDRQTSVAARAIFDAVGSECADAAMDFLQSRATSELRRQNLGVAARRYSPGYGDMPLTAQQLFFQWLELPEMGLTLTENFFIVPEKSVTAWAGVTALGETEK